MAPPSAADSLADQYELGDSAAEPVVEQTTSTGVASAPAASSIPPALSSPPLERDASGRFLPRGPAEHPAHLLTMARDLGLSDEEIAASSPDALAQTVRHISRILYRERADQSAAQTTQEAVAAPTISPPAPDAQRSASGPAGDETFDLPLDEGQYDPRITSMAKAVQKLLKENAELKGQVGPIANFHQQALSRSVTERYDRAFSKHKGWLGEGSFDSLAKDSVEMVRRKAVHAEAQKMKDGTLEEKVDRAFGILFGDQATPLTRPAAAPPTNGQVALEDAWRQAGLARPTQRGGEEEPGVRKATATAERIMRESGMLTETDPDGFLE